MNEIRRRDRDAEEIARIREIVGRHKLPNFVTGFDVQLGEFDGDPAMWIVFKRIGDEELGELGLRERGKEMNALEWEMLRDLLSETEGRYPYFRSKRANETGKSPS